MFAKDREAMRLTPAEVRLILIESLQWCANNAVYFLGLIGAATYDLAGTAFLVAAITLVRNLMTSVGNMVSGSVIDRFGPRRTSFVTCVITAVLSLGVGLAPLSVPGLVFAACVLGLAGGFINTCTHAFPGYLESTTEGRTRVNGLMVFYSNIAYTAGPLLGGAIVSCFATQSVYLLMAGMMGVAAVLSLGCHECVAPAKGRSRRAVFWAAWPRVRDLRFATTTCASSLSRAFWVSLRSARSIRWSRCSTVMCSTWISSGWAGCPRSWASLPRWARSS